VVSREEMGHELWSFNNALVFLIILISLSVLLIYGASKIFDIKKIKDNWSEQRCSPSVMPFASLFGYNTKENFEFCMGKIFSTHSMPMFGSVGTIFSNFTGLLQSIFDSIDSLRNILASLGGGINVIFQEFTERISTFFFKLRISAIHIKTLIGRMYAIMFSVMYMGMSGITGMTSFTNTFLFSFLDTFCFPGETEIHVKNRGITQIKDINIGDILLPTNSKVTGLFKFYSKGQPMVKIGSVIVSTNHYIQYNNRYIKAGEHPHAIEIGCWSKDEPLYCLGTHNNKIPVGYLTFLDYDETTEGDYDTMNFVQQTINSSLDTKRYKFKEYSPGVHPYTIIRTIHGNKYAKEIKIGDKLVTGSEVIGIIHKEINEICKLKDGSIVTPSTLIWKNDVNRWYRVGELYHIMNEKDIFISFIVTPNSQIELENNIRIRDYMELCSPDSETIYSKCIEVK
jgi:hypothetical protein